MRRRVLAAILVLPLLVGCSFAPLYGGTDAVGFGAGFAYAEPTNRLEQIIYQELAFRLGTNKSADAPRVKINASQSDRRIGRTSAGSVLSAHEAVVSASLIVTRGADGQQALSITRFTSTGFEQSGQVAADRAASETAGEKAARALADTFRLILVAASRNGEF
ncbi:MAG: hypothetical protein KKH72_05560 [Alphaproteobacteria bacterium]|nr:hypothetical protein [Alphaproteobacteria bacterium]